MVQWPDCFPKCARPARSVHCPVFVQQGKISYIAIFPLKRIVMCVVDRCYPPIGPPMQNTKHLKDYDMAFEVVTR